jgi:hypothetical protein
MRSPSNDQSASSVTTSEDTESTADPHEYTPEKIPNHRAREDAVQYLMKWKSLSDSENTWEDETESSQRGADPLIVAYHREKSAKSLELKKVTRQIPFDIFFGYTFSRAIHYRVRFENGLESDMTTEEVQQLDMRKLVDFLEGTVPRQKDLSRTLSPMETDSRCD